MWSSIRGPPECVDSEPMVVIILFILILYHEICLSSWQVLLTHQLKEASEVG